MYASGSMKGPTKVVGIICLNKDISPLQVLSVCLQESDSHSKYNDNFNVTEAQTSYSIIHAVYSKHKSRCTFIYSEMNDMMTSLEIARVSDILLFVVNGESKLTNLIDNVSYYIYK